MQPEPRSTRTFLVIWTGQLVSILGSGLTNFGIGVWVFNHTHSTSAFAMQAMAAAVPGVLLSPVAGALVDRWDRRIALIVSDAGAAISSLILAVLVLGGHLELWHIIVLTALSSAFSTLSWPAMSAAVTLLVPKRNFGRANGLLAGAEATSMILAPLLGAMVMSRYGLTALIEADVVSFAVAIGSLLLIRIPAPPRSAIGEASKESILREVSFGFRYIWKRKGLLGLLTYFWLLNLFGGFINVLWTPLLLIYFDRIILGQVLSMMGLGMLAGTLVMSLWGGPKKKVYGVLGFGAFSGVMLCFIALPPVWYLYAAAGFLSMASMPILNASSQAIWQVKTEPDVQGKVFAARRMIAWGSAPLAYIATGPLADKVFLPGLMPGGSLVPLFPFIAPGVGAGYRALFLVFGLLTAAAALIALVLPKLRNVERDLPDVTPRDLPNSDPAVNVEPVASGIA